MPFIPDNIVESISIGNVNSIGGQPAMLSNLAQSNTVQTTNLSHQNAVTNQQSLNELNTAILGKTVNKVSDMGAIEARGAVEVFSDNTLAESIAALNSVR